MATDVTTSYNGTVALGTSVFVEVRNPANGTVISARSNTGIREDKPGFYVWTGSLTDLASYEAIWDEGDGIYQGEVIPNIALAGGGSGTTLVVGQLAGGGATSPTTFLMKRGDTDPALRVQLLEPDPSDPTGKTLRSWAVPSGATVKFTMRDAGDFASETRTSFPSGAPKIHANATVDSGDRSIVTYGWDGSGDTDTNGTFRGEIEVTTTGGEIRSFPVGRTLDTNFITITIVDDADPGINP